MADKPRLPLPTEAATATAAQGRNCLAVPNF